MSQLEWHCSCDSWRMLFTYLLYVFSVLRHHFFLIIKVLVLLYIVEISACMIRRITCDCDEHSVIPVFALRSDVNI